MSIKKNQCYSRPQETFPLDIYARPCKCQLRSGRMTNGYILELQPSSPLIETSRIEKLHFIAGGQR
jgi:hypothetical protein